MSTALSVNLNKIALLRNSREGDFPNVRKFGQLCLDLGANGLTVHPRPDQRHIRVDDVAVIADLVSSYAEAEFNVEGNPFASPKGSYPGLLKLIEGCEVHQCTLVPDSDDQLTSDHGFDLNQDWNRLLPVIEQLKKQNVRISLFMDPKLEQIELAKKIGADRIELYTGPYAWAYNPKDLEFKNLFSRYKEAAKYAQSLGLGVNAGHDLNLKNLRYFLSIENILEVSIGHALTVDALLMGYEKAVTSYLKICE